MPDSSPTIDVVIAAAGSGERLGAELPKAFVEIGGVPMLRYALDAAAAIGAHRTVVAVPASGAARWIDRVAQLAAGAPVLGVAGGATRQTSVRRGLQALERDPASPADGEAHVVLVHDAARPCAGAALWRRVAAAAAREGGAVPVLVSVDSLKRVEDGVVVGSIDRARVVRAQTPQGFHFGPLLEAHRAAAATGTEATDDAALFEAAGRRVVAVPGDPGNLKVTGREDLAAAVRALAGSDSLRVGHGYDIHPLVAARRLVLGGVPIEYERGLAGHSDADALAHAVTDALLGAAGLGDIGQKFPADQARWKDADSIELLARVVADLAAAGFRPHNVDATILAEEPRLLPHLDAMRRRLADCLGLPVGAVNVKATRGEGLGPIGRGEGIAAHAVATVIAAAAG
jgi:2-C-methyl-D-erythritol 4-phosphate cytidylyltransferase/2-C-methyl-D-erythritol 2,4-cyclodiphosphate synthase